VKHKRYVLLLSDKHQTQIHPRKLKLLISSAFNLIKNTFS